mgnify:CR=1 FL=1
MESLIKKPEKKAEKEGNEPTLSISLYINSLLS